MSFVAADLSTRMKLVRYIREFNPEFRADVVFDIDDEPKTKLKIADINVSKILQIQNLLHALQQEVLLLCPISLC